ncbi:MAG: aminopeptidase P family protein [bacterium]
MFAAETYRKRREKLTEQIQNGILIFLGNHESPMNYADNCYRFRQDSSFLYYWGLDNAGFAAAIDIDENREIIYGNELTLDDVVWMGPQPSLQERCQQVGVEEIHAFDQLKSHMTKALAQGRKIHFLPQYRPDNIMALAEMLGNAPHKLNESASRELIHAVVEQRSVKTPEEIEHIEMALATAYDMHTYTMRHAQPGVVERELAGAIEGIALAQGGPPSFPIILSVHGETLHNHFHGNRLKTGDLLVCDAGAESALSYAADITRTTPVGGKFSDQQKVIYEIVLTAQQRAIAAIQPGLKFKEVHLLAAKEIAEGLKQVGIMQGDPDDAVQAGAHALFLPHGLGHMMGLDVHDMEGLGEDYVGYDQETRRSEQFGLSALRFGKRVQPGYVLTVEPGIYFIPQLIDMWRAENKFSEFINYDLVEKHKDFGGIRIEDNIVVTESGCRVLGKPIPKAVEDVERLASP